MTLVGDLTDYVSYDDNPIEAVQQVTSVQTLPTPEDLERRSPEDIRQVLSQHASWILSQEKSQSDKKAEYSSFCEKYEEAVHKAWLVSDRPPRNRLFGYYIENVAGSGAFGTVYKALSEEGAVVAMKLLNKPVSEHEGMLGNFRRGVRSMEILSRSGIEGMVHHKEAFQLPPCVVMEFVEGANLEAAVESGLFDRWQDGVVVGLKVGEIVRKGHHLPHRVLHRDLRPQNIMLTHFWEPGGWQDVVVLDFDLSWHRGATEDSVDIRGGAGLGYLAPEQLTRLRGVSTRSTAVDAYGLAMTMFFMFTGKHPEANESGYATWPERLRSAVQHDAPQGWRSLPNRLVRLVQQATYQTQSERIDLGDLVAELERIARALLEPNEMEDAEIWAEEVIASAFSDINYTWDLDRASGSIALASGVEVRVTPNEMERRVNAEMAFVHSGEREWRSISRFLPAKRDKAAAVLRRGGWEISSKTTGQQMLHMRAQCGIRSLKVKKKEATHALREAARELALE